MKAKKTPEGLWEIQVKDNHYSFEKWDAEQALDVILELSKIVGKPFGQLLGSTISGEKMDQKIDPDMLGVVFEGLTQNMKGDEVKRIIKMLCSEGVLCNGVKVNFKFHYQDKLMEMFLVVKAGLEVQLGPFFAEFLELVGVKAPKGITNLAKRT